MRPRSSKFDVGPSFQTCCRASGLDCPSSTRPRSPMCPSIQAQAALTLSRRVVGRPSARTTGASSTSGSRRASAATSMTNSGVESDEK